MTRRTARSSGVPNPVLAEDLPKPGDFDAIDPEDFEVVARGPALEAGRPFVLTVTVPLEMDAYRSIAQAAQAEGMDATEYIQRAVRRLGEALRDGR